MPDSQQPDHVQMNFSQITEEIFIGNDACCQIHFDKNLLKKGVEADISLAEERLDTPWGVKYFLWLPTKDHTAPNKHQLGIGVRTIDYFVQNKIKVYVHCKNGHGRAPTLVAAYFIAQGLSPEETIQKIKINRPEIHLEENQISALQKPYLKLGFR